MSDAARVTKEDLLSVLAEADVLTTFRRLPHLNQENFSRWIEKASDSESHWRRIEALVLALRMGPLQAEAVDSRASAGGSPT